MGNSVIASQSASFYLNRGMNRAARRDYNGAIADYTEALHLQPANSRAKSMRDRIIEWNQRSHDADPAGMA